MCYEQQNYFVNDNSICWQENLLAHPLAIYLLNATESILLVYSSNFQYMKFKSQTVTTKEILCLIYC